jgi:hypothetical protein
MDLKSLIAKMTAIEEGAQMAPPSTPEVPVEECGDEMMPAAVEECGMDMPGDMMSHAPKQSNSVTMNVSMNGSGAGGIRDLMDILRNLEDAGGSDEIEMPGDELIIGSPGDVGEIELPFADEAIDGGFGTATTKPNAEVKPVKAVTATGDDLASKGMMGRHGVAVSGSNGLRETLVARLAQHYQEVKER